MTQSSDHLTPRQQRAILALLSSPSHEAAAVAAGISRSSLYRWMDSPAFQAAYEQAQQKVVSHALTRLRVLSEKAVATLESVMDERTLSSSAKVTAAGKVLDYVFCQSGGTDDDLLARIDELEAFIRERFA